MDVLKAYDIQGRILKLTRHIWQLVPRINDVFTDECLHHRIQNCVQSRHCDIDHSLLMCSFSASKSKHTYLICTYHSVGIN